MKPPKAFIEQNGNEYTLKIMKVPVLEKGQLLPRGTKSKNKKNDTEDKFRNNVWRAKKSVYELVMNNEWEWFATLTINAQKYARTDLEVIKKDFTNWLRNTAVKLGCNLKRVIVPEQHNKGGWHFHFVLTGLPQSELQEITLSQKLNKKTRAKLLAGFKLFSWPACEEKFGYCQLERIGSKDSDKKAVANYMRNAIDSRDSKHGKHLYFASQKLERAKRIAEGYACRDLVGYTVFENGHCKTKKFKQNQLKEALSYVQPIDNNTTARDLTDNTLESANDTPAPENALKQEKIQES